MAAFRHGSHADYVRRAPPHCWRKRHGKTHHDSNMTHPFGWFARTYHQPVPTRNAHRPARQHHIPCTRYTTRPSPSFRMSTRDSLASGHSGGNLLFLFAATGVHLHHSRSTTTIRICPSGRTPLPNPCRINLTRPTRPISILTPRARPQTNQIIMLELRRSARRCWSALPMVNATP